MREHNYRFGPFVVERVRYRVLRGSEPVELTPKLLDLLLHLLDHAGTLVTKEQLLDALWPDANVTDNALAQAISELRQALGDDASTPRFIKTVARRGYRFIAPVEPLAPPAAEPRRQPAAGAGAVVDPAIAVLDFTNVTGDADAAWLSAGIAETVTGDLRAIARYRVVDRGRVLEAARRTDGSLQEVGRDLDAQFVVTGSFQRSGDHIRITGRIVDVESGEARADAKVDGQLTAIFELQDSVVTQFSKQLGLLRASGGQSGPRETPSLEAYRAYTEAWLHLETLDLRNIPQAVGGFQRAIAIDPRYALAFTGLASAEVAAYEATRSDNAPAAALLEEAIAHARRAVALDDTLAEAHATLGFALVSGWQTREAVVVARRAAALEPGNWRHHFRLGHASWGDERLRAAERTLALYPDFAFAHFQIAMVHVARGRLREAETVLRQGAAVQDRQVARGDRYPALGLHWLLAMVRLAEGDIAEALLELDREEQRADPHRLYGREYAMSARCSRGACLLRASRHVEAIQSFERALELYPDHGPSQIGLATALRASGASDRAASVAQRVPAILKTLTRTRPIEAALVESQLRVFHGTFDPACAGLCTSLESAPPGFAAWTIPIEPLLHELAGTEGFPAVLDRLADRAR